MAKSGDSRPPWGIPRHRRSIQQPIKLIPPSSKLITWLERADIAWTTFHLPARRQLGVDRRWAGRGGGRGPGAHLGVLRVQRSAHTRPPDKHPANMSNILCPKKNCFLLLL